MRFRRSAAAIWIVAVVGFSSALGAQKAKTPTLDEILQRLEGNLNHYDKSLPSLFCNEYVVSQVKSGGTERETVTDSVFRLKRAENPDHTASLVESREIKTVDGKPADSVPMRRLPSQVNGVFEGAFAVVSLGEKRCMRYSLEPAHGNGADEPYVVDFATALTRENNAECLLHEKSKGRVFLDPASMQITHFEMTTPHHLIIPGDQGGWPVVGKWVLTVEYAPVVLGGDTFWLPSMITSQENSIERIRWSFRANYSDYHRLEVTSRILPGEVVVR